MNILERYRKGETREAYEEIFALGDAAFAPAHFPLVKAVLEETFARVRHNLVVIHRELVHRGYAFPSDPGYSSGHPLLSPHEKTAKRLKQLEKAVASYGHIPLSFKLFIELVGSCNFAWDEAAESPCWWQFADPLQVFSLEDLLEGVVEGEELEMLADALEEDPTMRPHLAFSADYLHKDNVSGGMPYAIELTPTPQIDSYVLFEAHNLRFVEFLRQHFERGGFLRLTYPEYGNDSQAYLGRVLPLLKPI